MEELAALAAYDEAAAGRFARSPRMKRLPANAPLGVLIKLGLARCESLETSRPASSTHPAIGPQPEAH